MCNACPKVFDENFGHIEEGLADFILWNMTAFPLADDVTLQRQITKLAKVIRPKEYGWQSRLDAEMKRQEAKMERDLDKINKRSSAGTGRVKREK